MAEHRGTPGGARPELGHIERKEDGEGTVSRQVVTWPVMRDEVGTGRNDEAQNQPGKGGHPKWRTAARGRVMRGNREVPGPERPEGKVRVEGLTDDCGEETGGEEPGEERDKPHRQESAPLASDSGVMGGSAWRATAGSAQRCRASNRSLD